METVIQAKKAIEKRKSTGCPISGCFYRFTAVNK